MSSRHDPQSIQILRTFTPDGEPHYWLIDRTWPPIAVFADILLHGHDHTLYMSYPYITVTLANARAVYRVETLEQGAWTGTLVDAAVWGNPGDRPLPP